MTDDARARAAAEAIFAILKRHEILVGKALLAELVTNVADAVAQALKERGDTEVTVRVVAGLRAKVAQQAEEIARCSTEGAAMDKERVWNPNVGDLHAYILELEAKCEGYRENAKVVIDKQAEEIARYKNGCPGCASAERGDG